MIEGLIELLVAAIGATGTAGIVVAARSGTWAKSEMELANGGHQPARFEPPAMPMPEMDPWPIGFVPTAFWNLADWDDKAMRDGGEPFWMREPLSPRSKRLATPYSIDPVKEALAMSASMRAGLVPPHMGSGGSRPIDHSAGVCPTCRKPCRRIEIDGYEYYTCTNKQCVRSKQAWGTTGRTFVLVTKPTRWVPRDLCLYDDAHGWYVKPTGPINYDE